MSVTHVIFDFDGLLVDTETCYTKANEMLLKKYGCNFTPELNSKIMGRKEVEAIPWLLNEANVGIAHMVTATEYITQYDAILAEIFLKCKAMPGAERLVRHFHKKGIPQAICSGSRSITFGPKREPHKEWLDFITLKVFCGDEPDIKRGKPFPDPYLATMKRFQKKPDDPSKVLVFEDSPNGGRSAKAAGMKCVMVPNEKFFKEALDIGIVKKSCYSVTQVLRNLLEFRPEEYGLPRFD